MGEEMLSASGLLTMVAMMLLARGQRAGLCGLLTTLVDQRSKITLERERGRNLRQVLDQLPAGGEIIEQSLEPGRRHTIKIVTHGQPQGGAP
jgi:hypothetical protein